MTYTHPCFATDDVLDCDGHCDYERDLPKPERWKACPHGAKCEKCKEYFNGGKLF